MKNKLETQAAEESKKTKPEAPVAKESGPRARLTTEVLPRQTPSSATDRARASQEHQHAGAEKRCGPHEQRSTNQAGSERVEAKSNAARPRESLVGQKSASDRDTTDKGMAKRDQTGGRSADRGANDRSESPAKSPAESLKSMQMAERTTGQQSDAKFDQGEKSKLLKPGEQIKAQGSDSTVSKKAWETPGSFVVSNPDARTTRIEGFISPQKSDRTSAEGKLQKEAASRGGTLEKDQKWVGGHLVADSLGGPRVAIHGRETTAANLEPMDKRINESHIKVFEVALLAEMQKSPDKRLFLQVDSRCDKNGKPEWVTHRVFEQGKDGMPKGRPVREVQTRVDSRPEETLGETMKKAGGGSAADFHSADGAGTHRSRHGDH